MICFSCFECQLRERRGWGFVSYRSEAHGRTGRSGRLGSLDCTTGFEAARFRRFQAVKLMTLDIVIERIDWRKAKRGGEADVFGLFTHAEAFVKMLAFDFWHLVLVDIIA